MGFETLNTAEDEGKALEPITQDEVAFPDQELSDEAALKLVVQDVLLAESYLNSKSLPASWNTTDDLYRAAIQAQQWSGSNNARSNLSMPVVLEAVESLLPQAHMAFFSDPQPFLLQAKGKTSPNAARAMAKVVCWAIKKSGFQEEIRKALKSAFLYGNCLTKYGWERSSYKKRTYKRDPDGNVTISVEPVEVSCPTFEEVDLRNALVTPDTRCHDPRTAGAIIHQSFFTVEQLDALRDSGYENIPSREDLKKLLVINAIITEDSLKASKQETFRQDQAQDPTQQASADPLKQNLEILERWTGDRTITVLQRTIVLRNEPNEFDTKPFLGCAFIDVLNSFYGFGVAKLVEGEQRLQTGVMNAGIDVLSLHQNPMWKRKGGVGQLSQNILSAPGKVINDSGELELLQIPSVMDEAQAVVMASESRASRRVGANYGPDMPTQAMRTAEGVQAFTSGVQVRLQYFVEQFANLVYVPAIEAFIELAKNNLTPDQINDILSDVEGKTYQEAYGADVMDVYNGTYSVDVLSSTKLAGRRAAAQLMIPLMQMVASDPVQQSLILQNKKFDFAEFVEQGFDLAGYDIGTLFLEMTSDDQKRAAMSNQAVIKAQAQQQQSAQDQQNILQQIQAKGEINLATKLITHGQKAATDAAAVPLATQGAQ